MRLKIGILGTRGIPNNYGGFEQITEYLSEGLVNKGHDVTVYNSHNHPYQKNTWSGVQIQHCYDPEYLIKTAGQFIYDLNCIKDAATKKFDVVLFMGYTSSSVWKNFFPKNCVIISNMDGLEWKRDKYSNKVKRFLKYAENLAVKYSHYHIADSIAIKNYLDDKYKIDAQYIPYGVNTKLEEDESIFQELAVNKFEYYLLMARMEPENNIETILQGFQNTNLSKQFLVIGNIKNSYGKKLFRRFKNDRRIKFLGAIFNQDILHTLRKYCATYFHGHSVGGTNPSLLEAMASEAFIVAHNNVFNRSVLENDALYFSSANDISEILKTSFKIDKAQTILNNKLKIKEIYSLENSINEYEKFITYCYKLSLKCKTLPELMIA